MLLHKRKYICGIRIGRERGAEKKLCSLLSSQENRYTVYVNAAGSEVAISNGFSRKMDADMPRGQQPFQNKLHYSQPKNNETHSLHIVLQ